jgi:hypothetical protein
MSSSKSARRERKRVNIRKHLQRVRKTRTEMADLPVCGLIAPGVYWIEGLDGTFEISNQPSGCIKAYEIQRKLCRFLVPMDKERAAEAMFQHAEEENKDDDSIPYGIPYWITNSTGVASVGHSAVLHREFAFTYQKYPNKRQYP